MEKFNIRFNGDGTPNEIVKALEILTRELKNAISDKGDMPTGLIRGDKFETFIKTYKNPVKIPVKKDIPLTRKSLAKLKQAYDKAVKEEKECFIFDGNEVVTSYAKYLIEYMENYFK